MAETQQVMLSPNKNSPVYVVISFDYNNTRYDLLVNTVDPVSTNTSSTITRHPVPSGDMIADHMFRNPITMTISGTFSSHNETARLVFGDASSSWLASVQALFETIKNEGIRCTISKITYGNESKIKFQKRENMVLQSISWTEHIDSLDFTFNFEETMVIDIDDVKPASNDEGNLIFTNPVYQSFSSTLFDMNVVKKLIYDQLIASGMLEEAFFQKTMTYGAGATAGIVAGIGTYIGVSAIAGTAAGTAVLTTIGGAALATPVGWVAAAVVVGVIIAGVVINAIKQANSQNNKFKYKPWRLTGNQAEDEQRVGEFITFWDDLIKQLQTSADEFISVFQFPKIQDDQNQIMVLSVGDEIYDFEIVKNSLNNSHNLRFSYNGIIQKEIEMETGAKKSFAECSYDNAFAKLTNTYLYLVCPYDTEEGVKDLSNYFILNSSLDGSAWSQTIVDAFNKNLLKE